MQASIGLWNLQKLAVALAPLIPGDEKMIVERTDFGKRIKINLLLTMSRLLELALVAFLRLLFTFYPEKGFEA